MIELSIEKVLQTAVGKQLLSVNCSVNQGDFCAIYGESGIGKTTLLRIIAGLSAADKGTIKVNGVHWLATEQRINWSPQERGVGMVFQDYALFPNMTIEQQLRFANAMDASLLKELLEIMEIKALKDQKPHQLSGGQQQRVALARALMQKPQLLLLDEPLSALDERLNKQMRALLQKIQQLYGTTIFMVSHNVEEIAVLANKLLAINHEETMLYENTKQFFLAKGLLEKLTVQGVVGLKDNKKKQIIVKLSNSTQTVKLEEEAFNAINVGDTISLESMVRPTIYQLKK